MINFSNKDPQAVRQAIIDAGHSVAWNEQAQDWTCSNAVACQAIIDALPEPMSDISPFQFLYMLAITRIDVAVDQLLPNVRNSNLQLYGQIKAKLQGSGWFEWDKSLVMLQQLKPSLLQIDSTLDLSVATLKQRWMEASKVKNN